MIKQEVKIKDYLKNLEIGKPARVQRKHDGAWITTNPVKDFMEWRTGDVSIKTDDTTYILNA